MWKSCQFSKISKLCFFWRGNFAIRQKTQNLAAFFENLHLKTGQFLGFHCILLVNSHQNKNSQKDYLRLNWDKKLKKLDWIIKMTNVLTYPLLFSTLGKLYKSLNFCLSFRDIFSRIVTFVTFVTFVTYSVLTFIWPVFRRASSSQ